MLFNLYGQQENFAPRQDYNQLNMQHQQQFGANQQPYQQQQFSAGPYTLGSVKYAPYPKKPSSSKWTILIFVFSAAYILMQYW